MAETDYIRELANSAWQDAAAARLGPSMPWEDDWRIDSLDPTGRRCLCSRDCTAAGFTHFGKLFLGPTHTAAFESFSLQTIVGLQVKHSTMCQPVGGTLDGDLPLTVYPRLDGLTLAEWLDDSSGTQPMSARLAIASQIVSGLVAVHQAGFVHRRLCSEHVLVLDSGDVRLVGWGHCQTVGAVELYPPSSPGSSSTSNHASPSPNARAFVCPPEMWLPEHEVSSAQDIYQVAYILSDLLGGSFLASQLGLSLLCSEPCARPTAAELLLLLDEISEAIFPSCGHSARSHRRAA